VHKIYCVSAREQNIVADSIARISAKLRPYMMADDKIDDEWCIEKVIYSKSDHDEQEEKVKKFLERIYCKLPVFAYPKNYTERERNQQSIFMIFCNKIKDTQNKIILPNSNIMDSLLGQKILGRFIFVGELYNQLPHDYKEESEAIEAEIESLRVENAAYKEHIAIKNRDTDYLFEQLQKAERQCKANDTAFKMVTDMMSAYPDEFDALLKKSRAKKSSPTSFNGNRNTSGKGGK